MKIVFIGRPGVGKTTFFSRLTKRKTYDRPVDTVSLTSDSQTAVFVYDGVSLVIEDTVGLVDAKSVRKCSDMLLAADLVFMMCDPCDFNTVDTGILTQARKFAKILWIVANKVESHSSEDEVSALYEYGFPVFAISALHKKGIDELFEAVLELGGGSEKKELPVEVSCLVVGAPNAGKSTFLNAVLGQRRFRTSAIPGTTNEIVAEIFKSKEGLIKFYDSAGIFRRYKRAQLRTYNMSLFKDALRQVDVVCFLIDGALPVTQKDLRIAAMIKHKPCILVYNKSDIISLKQRRKLKARAVEIFAYLPDSPLFMISAAKNKGVRKVVSELFPLKKRSGTEFFSIDKKIKKIAAESRLHLFILMAVQTAFSPPKILIKFRSKRKDLTDSDKRYFERLIRENYDLKGVPLKIIWKKL